MRDLQRRLAGAGFVAAGAEPGTFCDATRAAVAAFQQARGLHPDGACDEPTWLALVEASWRLGDRPLVLAVPHLRGDDVTRLQLLLGKLGFDCGRVDGVFGVRTAAALEDFQRNAGLEADGICGPKSVRALDINSAYSGSGPGIATVREIEGLSGVTGSLAELRIVIGQFGGLSSLVRAVVHQLRPHGVKLITADETDPALQADAANHFGAHVYLGFEAHAAERATVAHYATEGFVSYGGLALAHHLATAMRATDIGAAATERGMRLPVLRRTQMTAVVCALGPVQRVSDAAHELATAVVEALDAWVLAPSMMPQPATTAS